MSSTYIPAREHWQREQYRTLFMASVFVVLCCAIGAVSSGSGRITMIFLSIGSLGICSLMLMAMRHIAPELLLPRLVLASYALQCFWLISVAVFDIGVTDETALTPQLYYSPYRAVLPNLIVPLAALAAVALWRMLPFHLNYRHDLWQLSGDAPRGLSVYLVGSAVLLLLSWPAGVGGDTPAGLGFLDQGNTQIRGYIVRVVEHAFSFMPLLMGRYFRQFPRSNRLWLFALACNSIIGLSVGGRSFSLIPIALYLIGRVLGQPRGNRSRSMGFALALVIPIFVLSGAIGVVRNEIGRGDFSLFSLERVEETSDSVWSYLANGSNTVSQGILFNGPGRMVVWPNLSATILTPESIPYRGFDGFPSEVSASFKIFALAGVSRQGLNDADLFNYPATLYGYTINTDTSVEWGVLADGWSRGGLWSAFLFGFVLSLFFVVTEYALVMRGRPTPTVLLLFGILVGSALTYTATATLLYIVRQTVLDCALLILITFLVERLRPGVNDSFSPNILNNPSSRMTG